MNVLICLLVLALAVPLSACSGPVADSLTVVSTPESITVSRGETIPITVVFKNTLTPREPIVFTAEIEWQDEYGQAHICSASTSVLVVQRLTVTSYAVVIPPLFEFVVGSATLNGQPIEPAFFPDQLTLLRFDLDVTLREGESLVLEYTLRAL